MTILRSHLYLPIVDSLGALRADIEVRVYEPGTTALVTDTLYAGPSGNSELSQPVLYGDGIVDFYLSNPRRVRLGVTPPGESEFYLEDVDLRNAGENSVLADQVLLIKGAVTPNYVLTAFNDGTARWSPSAGGGGPATDDVGTWTSFLFGDTRWIGSPPIPTTIDGNNQSYLKLPASMGTVNESQPGTGVTLDTTDPDDPFLHLTIPGSYTISTLVGLGGLTAGGVEFEWEWREIFPGFAPFPNAFVDSASRGFAHADGPDWTNATDDYAIRGLAPDKRVSFSSTYIVTAGGSENRLRLTFDTTQTPTIHSLEILVVRHTAGVVNVAGSSQLTSPDGTVYDLGVDNTGRLTTTLVP